MCLLKNSQLFDCINLVILDHIRKKLWNVHFLSFNVKPVSAKGQLTIILWLDEKVKLERPTSF